jgi:hypothetical protein
MYEELTAKMSEKGIRPADLGKTKKDMDSLKKSVFDKDFKDSEGKLKRLSEKLYSIEVDHDFLLGKKSRLEQAIKRIQPRGDLKKNIDEKLRSAEFFIQQDRYPEVNGIYNEIFEMLGDY